ncbi:GtrA family protein [Aureimonas populi]|uniref:GtrA family protein n=1 Tax=Aureimonas populi TaxID=1701758 RepID=A0ABW5CKR2_9HYPH|nr:GtrA family protein [Aureimonas populi]
MFGLFSRYLSVGVVNTALHWLVFALLLAAGATQALANFLAFCVAVTFSFFANARWTFRSAATPWRYVLYVCFMGALAALVGWGADRAMLHPVMTLVAFSLVSLLCGFAYSRLIVFKVSR